MSQKEFKTFAEFLLQKNNFATVFPELDKSEQEITSETTSISDFPQPESAKKAPVALVLADLSDDVEKRQFPKLQSSIGKPHTSKGGKVKDYFIPHVGNDYKPHALHPKRIAFHATSAIIIKVVMFLFVVSFPVEAWLAPEELSAQSQQVVTLTNSFRKEAHLPELKVSQRLTQAAQLKVQDMLVAQYFAHLSPSNLGLANWLSMANYPYRVAGENLAMGFASAAEVFESWRKSPTHNANLIDPDFKEIGVAAVTGKYQDVDTTMMAQMFGTPTEKAAASASLTTKKLAGQVLTVAAKATEAKAPVQPVAQMPEQGVAVTAMATEQIEPQLTPEGAPKATIVTHEPEKGKLLIKVEAFVPRDTSRAQVSVAGRKLDLEMINPNSGMWTLNSLVYTNEFDSKQPTVPAVLSVWNKDGVRSDTDVNASNLKPNSQTVLQQYQMLRSEQPKFAASLFSVTSYYYLVLLVLAMISLVFMIAVEFNRQHPKLIASTAGLIGLLVVLILI
ncbi:hypothetical protein HGA64_02600 [Candidatus Falkowbacteria bacterium]|nr:hypothetical protein [Candidatus Falkowbacteria bacterium]